MTLKHFIDRPVLAAVISIVIVLGGIIGVATLPRRAVPRHRAPDGDGACQLSGRQRRNHPEERHHSA